MKSKSLLTILLLFVIHIIFAQGISKNDILKHKIKSISTIDSDKKIKIVEYYNDKGDIIKTSSPNNKGELQLIRKCEYNDTFQLIEEYTYNYKGEVNSSWKYFYNDKNQLIKKQSISSGDVDATWVYEYDKKENKVTETQTSETIGNTITKYKYDENNLLSHEDKSNKLIGKEEKIDDKYSDKKQIMEKKTLFYYSNTTLTLTYLYDNTDKLIKIVEKSSNGVSSTTKYEYDDKGLLKSNIWESSLGKIPHKTTYQIKI
jgi:hypothetical protein